MKQSSVFVVSAFLIIPALIFGNVTHAQTPPLNPNLERGIGEYKHENYEEALPLLLKAKEEEPGSTMAAYYLGLNYKQQQMFHEAIPHLRFAVSNPPKIKGALIELIDSLYQVNELAEAHRWIEEAETEGIRPAQVAFLKGLVLVKEDKNAEAVEAFEKAKALDKFMEQACDYQIGIARLKLGDYDNAEAAFQAVVVLNPASNMATYANEYIDSLKRRQKGEKPWRLTAGLHWQYDDNVVLLPSDESVATDITDKADSREVYTLMVERNHRFTDELSLAGQYHLYFAKQNDLGFFDTLSHTVVIQPNIASKDKMLSFPLTYTQAQVNDRSYLSTPGLSGIYNFMAGDKQMGQVFLKYDYKNYLWTPSTVAENRDSHGLGTGLGWYVFFAKRKGFVNLRYGHNSDWARGNNWSYLGNRLAAAALIPLTARLNLTLTGGTNFQRYANTHTIFNQRRRDNVHTGSVLLAYKIIEDHELQFQYSYVQADSNLTIYDYNRNIYSVGVQLRF